MKQRAIFFPKELHQKVALAILKELDIPGMSKRIAPAVEAEFKRSILRAVKNMGNDLDVASFFDRAAEKKLAAMMARAFKKMK